MLHLTTNGVPKTYNLQCEHTCTKAFDANSAPILNSIDESVVNDEEAVLDVPFLVELSAIIGAPEFGLSMSKYTGIIGTEIQHNRPIINVVPN